MIGPLMERLLGAAVTYPPVVDPDDVDETPAEPQRMVLPIVDVDALHDQLRTLHAPVRTSPYQPNPYRTPEVDAGKPVCRGCGGVMWWPCITRRLLDGEPVDIALELVGASRPVGTPGVDEDKQ